MNKYIAGTKTALLKTPCDVEDIFLKLRLNDLFWIYWFQYAILSTIDNQNNTKIHIK
jgi:hypothetical protein